MARRLESDKLLFVAVVVLVLFGALMVFSASAVMASQLYGNTYYFLFRQLAWVGVGLVLMVGMMNVDYRRLASPRLIFPALGLQLVLLVAVLFRSPTHHAHRWFHIWAAGFQPSELSKIILVIFLAYFLDLRKGAVNDWKHTLVPIGLVAGSSVALILKGPGCGTALAIGGVVAAMLFPAGVRLGGLRPRRRGLCPPRRGRGAAAASCAP